MSLVLCQAPRLIEGPQYLCVGGMDGWMNRWMIQKEPDRVPDLKKLAIWQTGLQVARGLSSDHLVLK